jgi:hypothetical protein
VKSSPYIQHTCFRGQQGISPLAPKFHQMSSHPAWALSPTSLPTTSQASPALPGVTILCPGTPRALARGADAAKSGFVYVGAPGLRDYSRPPALLLAEIGGTYPYAPLSALSAISTDCSDRFTPGRDYPAATSSHRASCSHSTRRQCVSSHRLATGGLGWLGPWVHYAPGVCVGGCAVGAARCPR